MEDLNLFCYTNAMHKTRIYGLHSKDIDSILMNLGQKTDHTSLLMNLIYRQYNKKLENYTQVSPKVRDHLSQYFNFELPKIIKTQKASDGTVKFLVVFEDGKSVETVCLPFRNKHTLCVSSQVGCAMNCSFCHTATQGLKRNLTPEEIVCQYLVAQRYMKEVENNPLSITNMVFMGQGEPLHNFDNLKRAIDILTDPLGISLGRQNITVSTSGYLPGLKRFKELGVNFALSLHSTHSSVRNELIPINKAYPLDEIMQELDKLELGPRQSIVYEYLLIKDLNNTKKDVEGLFHLLGNRNAYINIIPFNEFPGSKYKRPSDVEIEEFKNQLVSHNLNVLVRKTKGDDILAACGQLKS